MKTKSTSSLRGWHAARVDAVKRRFQGALEELQRGHMVLMHDADVFFRSGGLGELLTTMRDMAAPSLILREHQGTASLMGSSVLPEHTARRDRGMLFLVQDNGKRDTNFDRLNWGFTFLMPDPITIKILECTLASWDHEAFKPPSHDNRDSYFQRSQPRINHVIEDSIRNWVPAVEGEDSKTLDTARSKQLHPGQRICLVGQDVTSGKMRHFTGHLSAAGKIMCAKAQGYLFEPLEPVILYDVVPGIGVEEQAQILATAIAWANHLSIRVAVPRAYDKFGQPVAFCNLFFFETSLNTEVFAAFRPTEETSAGSSRCTTVNRSSVAMAGSSSASTHEVDIKVCVPAEMHERFQQQSPGAEDRKKIRKEAAKLRAAVRVCDPLHPESRPVHQCTRHGIID